jgi:hypothetical protein
MSTRYWPAWAREQLLGAVSLASSQRSGRPLARDLYELWFAGPVATDVAPRRPLMGEYRRAHVATASSVRDGLSVLDCHDKLGTDGWWRTWNTTWRPRPNSTRVLLSPRADAAGDLVAALTGLLRDVPYLLACPTEASRLTRSGAAALYVPRTATLSPDLATTLAPLLRADTPPLCLPVAPGVAVAQYPDNGMTFGEHRCHLVAMALGRADRGEALTAIADVFSAHGVDPCAPYRTARRALGLAR